jgi:iron complex outermembrane receptor protein
MNRQHHSRRLLSLAVAAVTGLPLPAVYAQEAGLALEEVMVTARKREESLQDTPVSVTALQAGDIEARSMSTLADLSNFAPNLEINNGRGDAGSTNASIFIRGVGQNDFIFPTDPGVGLYIDGVYVARSIGGMLDLADIERIEVLRGPQGTLYGKNTIGGAVNVITTRPGNELEGRLGVTVGEDSRIDVTGRINFPIIDDMLYGKLAFVSKQQDGYVERADGVDLGNKDLQAYRLALRWTPNDDMEINLAADWSDIDQNGSAGSFVSSFATSAQALFNGVAAPFEAAKRGLPAGSVVDDRWNLGDIYRSAGTGNSFDRNESSGVQLSIDWQLSDNVALKSITAYRKMDAEIAVDLDHTPFALVETNQQQEQDQFSQELQLSGDAFDGRLHWLVGAYYFKEDAQDRNQTLLASGIYDALNLLPADVVPLFPPNAPATCPGGNPALGLFCAGGAGNPVNALLDFDVSPYTEVEANTRALFTHLSYDITDNLSATLGARYTWEEKDFFINSRYPNSGRIAMPATADSQDWTEFTPKIGVDYQLTDNAMIYASYSEGFKSGGWNPRVLSPEEYARYDQESLSTWELGLKSTLLDQRLRLNIAVFQSDYEDLQLVSNVVSPTTGGLLLIMQNAGEVSIQGLELELVARPANGLDVQLGLGYLDAEYDELAPGIGWSIDNELPDAPELSVNAAIQYAMDLSSGATLTMRLDASWKDKTYKDPFNVEAIAQDSYLLSNARVSWLSADEQWQLAVFALNLSDEDYITSSTSVAAFGINTANYGRPRQWGVSLNYNF